MRPLRRIIFAGCAGFSMATIYLDACASNPKRMPEALPGQNAAVLTVGSREDPQNRWRFKHSFLDGPAPKLQTGTSLIKDVETAIQENESTAVFIMFLINLAGGWAAMLGCGAAFVFDGKSGTRRYQQIKDILAQ